MYCSQCGSELKENVLFCTKCGTRIGGQPQPKTESSSPSLSVKDSTSSSRQKIESIYDNLQAIGYDKTVKNISDTVLDILGTVISMIKKPVKTSKEIAETEDKCLSHGLIIFHIIVMFLCTIVFWCYVNSKGVMSINNADMFISAFKVSLVVATLDYGMAGLLLFVTKIFKKESNYIKMLAVVSSAVTFRVSAFIVGGILLIFNANLSMIVFLCLHLYSLIAMIMSFMSISTLEEEKLYSIMIALILFAVVVFIIFNLVYQRRVEQAKDYFEYIMTEFKYYFNIYIE